MAVRLETEESEEVQRQILANAAQDLPVVNRTISGNWTQWTVTFACSLPILPPLSSLRFLVSPLFLFPHSFIAMLINTYQCYFSNSGCVRYCEKCKCIKPDRAHHCSVCGCCVLKMDHHCKYWSYSSIFVCLAWRRFCNSDSDSTFSHGRSSLMYRSMGEQLRLFHHLQILHSLPVLRPGLLPVRGRHFC